MLVVHDDMKLILIILFVLLFKGDEETTLPPPLVAPIAIRPMGSAGLGIVNNKRKLFASAETSSNSTCGPPQKSPKVEISPVSTPTNSSGCHEGFGHKRMCIPPPPAPPTPASKRRISRKLAFDEDKTSPVSGTIIRGADDFTQVSGFIGGWWAALDRSLVIA